jgi:hypothetical protein
MNASSTERTMTPARARRAGCALAVTCALTLAACGPTRIGDADASADDHIAPAALPPGAAGVAADASARVAQRAYNRETRGSKLQLETRRLAHDAVLLRALAGGKIAAARAEAHAQLFSPANHFNHVTRISVIRGSRALVNATLNADGVFVDAPAREALALRGRALGTLLVSIQDVTGFVKLVHRLTRAEVVARGASGQVRTSLPAAAHAPLPASGSATVAGRSYTVRSFRERAWGGEALTVWILEPA